MNQRPRSTLSVLLMVAVLAAVAGAASGQTVIYVDASATGSDNGTGWADAYTSVQPALNAAQPGDQVWVAAGTYVERITLKNGVALYGGFAGTEDPATFDLVDRDFAANETTLDGNHAGSVVKVLQGATSTTRIDGFTITNGYATLGAGLNLNRCSPTIANNTITGNSSNEWGSRGGGLYLIYSSPEIVNNTIADNHVHSWGEGGGLFLWYSSAPMITDNIITGNYADYVGGAIAALDSSPTIVHNTMADNTAGVGGALWLGLCSATVLNNVLTGNRVFDYLGDGHGLGGAVALFEADGASMIANNTITANFAYNGGGGLYVEGGSTLVVANNTIAGNSTHVGGGLCMFGGSPTITNNAIVGNTAYRGCALYLGDSSPTISNNLIVANHTAYPPDFPAGAVSIASNWSTPTPTIANNTIVGNNTHGLSFYDASPTIVNTIVAFNFSGVVAYGEDSPLLQNNCVYGNTAFSYYGVSDPTGSNGNISADPLFADPESGHWHIQPDSPCLDAGANGHVHGSTDIDGQPRIQPLGGTVDIGGDESDGTVWPTGPYAIVRVSPAGDDWNDGSSWPLAKGSVQAAIDATAAFGGEVWVEAGTYYERIVLHAYTHVYGGFSGSEASREQRDWGTHGTILDGRQQGSVVTSQAGYGTGGTIDGFSITNGSGTSWGGEQRYGGGVYVYGTSPTIANCTIRNNRASAGGAMYVRDSFATMANNVIVHNRGSALYLESGSPTIANHTITGNSASWGGALHIQYSSPTFVNSIVAYNSSGVYRVSGSGSPALQHNSVYGNDAYDYSGIIDPTGTYGNISSDPVFVQSPEPGPDGTWGTDDDVEGDLHLTADSPCVDGGTNGYAYGEHDLDGHPRIVNGDGEGEAVVDMGAYEFQGTAAVLAMDIKPGSCPNSFNRDSHGVLPVTLLGTDDFDATLIDIASILLWRVDEFDDRIGGLAPHEGPPGPHSVFEDVGTPFDGEDWCDCHDLGGDGIVDLLMHFKTDDVMAALELDDLPPGDLVELVVTGNLLDGTPFTGSDCVRLVPPGTPPGQLSVQSNISGVWVDLHPLDEQLDGGGFANFERTYPLGSLVTLTAPSPGPGTEHPFVGWEVNGVMQGAAATLRLLLDDDATARAVYDNRAVPVRTREPIRRVVRQEVTP